MPQDQPYSRHIGVQVPVLVWDLPVRVVHWLIVLLVTFSFLTAEGGFLGWHKLSGYAIVSLVIFRVYWGFCGSSTARFAHFLRGPNAVARYVCTLRTRDGQTSLGHNPLGGWNVIALLFVLLLQALSGLFAVDVDGLESGPLAKYVSFGTGRRIAGLHDGMFNILELLIGLHIAAVLLHLLYYKQNLIVPMFTGVKRFPHKSEPTSPYALWRVMIGLAGGLLLVLVLISL
jgi:cytochrome b